MNYWKPTRFGEFDVKDNGKDVEWRSGVMVRRSVMVAVVVRYVKLFEEPLICELVAHRRQESGHDTAVVVGMTSVCEICGERCSKFVAGKP